MTHQALNQVANINGGGLSVLVSGKYTSVRHERARIDGKHTAGESVKILKKQGIIISAKELVSDWKLLTGSEPEWHHAGFYKPQNNKRKCMGRTFFFTDQNLYHYAANIDKIKSIKDKIEQEMKVKSLNLVAGFYWIWDHDYNGRYGKRVNFKRLCIYQGSELNAPKGFVKCDNDEFACAEMFQGAKYYGWDEPSKSEFTKERYENELKRKIKQKKVDSKNYVKRLRLEELDTKKAMLVNKVKGLVAIKNKLYSNMDIESPMSNDERMLNKEISDIFSEINSIILLKRKINK